jgi:YD repeat-containing protein
LGYIIQHRLSYPIEVLEEKNNNLIKASLTSFKGLNNSPTDLTIPYKDYTIESSTTFTKINTEVRSNSNNNTELIIDTKYKVKGEYLFDQFGNLKTYQKTDDIPISFIYGYTSSQLVVEAKNVDFASLNSAVTTLQPNFETFLQDLGDFTDLNKRADWKTFNSSLRSKLPNARIVSYTYIPMIGMTSKTDENGIATYYFYDALGRLIFEQDDKNNIVKKYDYHYTGQ